MYSPRKWPIFDYIRLRAIPGSLKSSKRQEIIFKMVKVQADTHRSMLGTCFVNLALTEEAATARKIALVCTKKWIPLYERFK